MSFGGEDGGEHCLTCRFNLLPLDSTRYVSTALRLHHTSGADRFHFSLCVNFHQVLCAVYLLHPSSGSPEPSGIDTQDFCFWWMLEHDAAIR